MIAIWKDKIRVNEFKTAKQREDYLVDKEAEIITWAKGPIIHNKKSQVINQAEKDNVSQQWRHQLRNHLHRHVLKAERDLMKDFIDSIDEKLLGKQILPHQALSKARSRQENGLTWWYPRQMTKSLRQMVAWEKAVKKTEGTDEEVKGNNVIVFGAPINPYLVRFNLSTI